MPFLIKLANTPVEKYLIFLVILFSNQCWIHNNAAPNDINIIALDNLKNRKKLILCQVICNI